jgi:hypothetical protein
VHYADVQINCPALFEEDMAITGLGNLMAVQRIWLVFDLLKLFVKHPVVSLRNVNAENIRRLVAAMGRHNRATVVGVVGNNLKHQTVLRKGYTDDSLTASQESQRKVRELERKYPGITEPVALSNICMLEEKIAPVPYVISGAEPVRVNILLPQLDPHIMFGGYISCLHFIRRLREENYRVRIVLCDSGRFDREAVLDKLSSNPQLRAAVDGVEFENISTKERALKISGNDAFVAYSYWTALIAHQLASAVGKEYIFFLQEYEAIFHPHDSCYALASYVYQLPHYAVFNTRLLADYFRERKLGVFSQFRGDQQDAHHVIFQHALTPTAPPTVNQMAQRQTRRLLFYGRPEAHAKRNLFEIALIGLKMAVRQDIFDENWEFVGIGTLGSEHSIELGNGHVLELKPSLPLLDYAESLRSFDVGMSLMMAPHPSIIPFEMASSGMVVVTNSFESRTADVLQGISRNIEPCLPAPQSVAESLRKAVDRVEDFQARYDNSDLDWVMDWDQSFNKSVMEKVGRFISARAVDEATGHRNIEAGLSL